MVPGHVRIGQDPSLEGPLTGSNTLISHPLYGIALCSEDRTLVKIRSDSDFVSWSLHRPVSPCAFLFVTICRKLLSKLTKFFYMPKANVCILTKVNLNGSQAKIAWKRALEINSELTLYIPVSQVCIFCTELKPTNGKTDIEGKSIFFGISWKHRGRSWNHKSKGHEHLLLY